MAITIPQHLNKKSSDFISGNNTEDTSMKLVNLRIPSDLLARIDEAAKKAGLNRSGYIRNVLSLKLNNEE